MPTSHTLFTVSCALGAIVLVATAGYRASANSLEQAAPQFASGIAQCPDATENPLPLPSSVSPDQFHDLLLTFLRNTEYVTRRWCVDKGVRDTGPYVYQEYLGTHPAVRFLISEMIDARLSKMSGGRLWVAGHVSTGDDKPTPR